MKLSLEQIRSPEDIRKMTSPELEELCASLRKTLVQTVSKTGGHLSSNLGVVELTVALHKMFNTPHDRIVWDVGHQCYTHKLLTGRYSRFDTLRQTGGLSGFPKPEESEYDTFIAGHSSTAVSAANGMAKAKTLSGDGGYVVAVLGDGALTGGLAYEGLSNAGRSSDRLIVVLNDNRMSISKNVGFVARHLATLRSRPRYVRFKMGLSSLIAHIPLIGKAIQRMIVWVKSRLKNAMYHNSTLFEEMGFYYLGPVDGHNLHDLTAALQIAKNLSRPVLLHVETIKGKGYSFAMQNPDTYHGVSGFDIETGKTPASSKSFSSSMVDGLCRLAQEDLRICAITAAMKSGTCLTKFAERFPVRFFDVGIAEEYAVTFASGLATGGMLPVFAVYSTFLQRCYDQILNDTSIMNNHIVLAVDRAGIVPDDGETHQGVFDVPFLTTIPHVTIYSPSTFAELDISLKQALYDAAGIAVVRYPKGGELPGCEGFQPDYKPYTHLKNAKARTLLITYGRLFSHALIAARELSDEGVPVSLLKLTRIWPLPEECAAIASEYERVLFFEEGSLQGGIGRHLQSRLLESGFGGTCYLRAIDGFLPACSVSAGFRRTGLDVDGMVEAVREAENRGQPA